MAESMRTAQQVQRQAAAAQREQADLRRVLSDGPNGGR